MLYPALWATSLLWIIYIFGYSKQNKEKNEAFDGLKSCVATERAYSPVVNNLECIFLPSVHTLAFGTPQPICPLSPAIHFSIFNYSNNVEVFIRCSSPPAVFVHLILQHYYGWRREHGLAQVGEFAQRWMNRGTKTQSK